jgi:hypothetical protein
VEGEYCEEASLEGKANLQHVDQQIHEAAAVEGIQTSEWDQEDPIPELPSRIQQARCLLHCGSS